MVRPKSPAALLKHRAPHILRSADALRFVQTPTRTSMRRPLIIAAAFTFATVARAQDPGVAVPATDAKHGGSDKMKMLSHVAAHPGAWKAADIEMEQDRDRPYVYVCGFVNFDVQIY